MVDKKHLNEEKRICFSFDCEGLYEPFLLFCCDEGSGHGHGGPSMGTLIAGGAAAAYGAHHLSHGGHHSSHGSHHLSHGHHHGKFKQGKFKHGKFGKHKKHGKHHGGKVLEVQEMKASYDGKKFESTPFCGLNFRLPTPLFHPR
ncbi:hypothetical protein HYC85_010569 [Camellia sinensis]|uniref:Uncharacterized protein n=1 Tax=Camellia sinensis TaxID=4442 RepID=A0A7J7HJ75_CAMSI|nr:hypothetical protein HYC85_010569 [Camellia sinensis]